MNHSNKKIFIFDDDSAILDIFSIVLESSGYTIFTSQTSDDIIEKVNDARPDLIIMDNWIPSIGGIEATNLLKNNDEFKHIPVIYCSANSDISNLAKKAGADVYLAKPFDLDELENLVAYMLKQ